MLTWGLTLCLAVLCGLHEMKKNKEIFGTSCFVVSHQFFKFLNSLHRWRSSVQGLAKSSRIIWFDFTWVIETLSPIVVSPLKCNTFSHTHTPSPFSLSLAEKKKKKKSLSSDSAFSQSVRLLPWRVLDLKFVPAVPLLVAPTGGVRSQWTRVSKLSQSLHRNPTRLFLHNVCQ